MFDWYHKNRRFDVSLVSSINLNILLLLLCVLAEAFPTYALRKDGAVGWRVVVTKKRGSAKTGLQVEVSGAWFKLEDRCIDL